MRICCELDIHELRCFKMQLEQFPWFFYFPDKHEMVWPSLQTPPPSLHNIQFSQRASLLSTSSGLHSYLPGNLFGARAVFLFGVYTMRSTKRSRSITGALSSYCNTNKIIIYLCYCKYKCNKQQPRKATL